MKTRNYLLPYSCKKAGMWMFLPFAATCLCLLFNVRLPEIEVPWIAFGDDIFYRGKANLIKELGILFIMGLDFLVFTCAAIYLYFLVYILKFNFTMKAIRREGR